MNGGRPNAAGLFSLHVLNSLKRLLSRAHRSLFILGVGALAIAAIAAYVGAVIFLSYPHVRGAGEGARRGDLAQEGDRKPPAQPKFAASDYRQSRFPRLTRQPLIGVNYTHYAFPNCSLDGTGILRTYSKPGIAQRVHTELYQMRKAGVATIRTIIFHMTDATGRNWGPIPSAGGMLREPYRTNLIRFLTEIRKFGFARFTASLGPTGTNNPRLAIYDPAKLTENWRFLETVRGLVKRYGPPDTRIDLMSEAAPSEAPSDYFPLPRQIGRYLRILYRLYVGRFGNRDVTISTIAPTFPGDMTNRMGALVHILRSTHEPMPRWYEVHIPYDPVAASFALRNVDMVLRANRQNQPLVIGEAAYDSAGVANAIRRFLESSSRRIDEVTPWFLRVVKGCWVPPPYKPGAYARELYAR
jgi:hypothetical protein